MIQRSDQILLLWLNHQSLGYVLFKLDKAEISLAMTVWCALGPSKLSIRINCHWNHVTIYRSEYSISYKPQIRSYVFTICYATAFLHFPVSLIMWKPDSFPQKGMQPCYLNVWGSINIVQFYKKLIWGTIYSNCLCFCKKKKWWQKRLQTICYHIIIRFLYVSNI